MVVEKRFDQTVVRNRRIRVVDEPARSRSGSTVATGAGDDEAPDIEVTGVFEYVAVENAQRRGITDACVKVAPVDQVTEEVDDPIGGDGQDVVVDKRSVAEQASVCPGRVAGERQRSLAAQAAAEGHVVEGRRLGRIRQGKACSHHEALALLIDSQERGGAGEGHHRGSEGRDACVVADARRAGGVPVARRLPLAVVRGAGPRHGAWGRGEDRLDRRRPGCFGRRPGHGQRDGHPHDRDPDPGPLVHPQSVLAPDSGATL